MRIAMISEHASPLAALGGADAGGQNVHVAALSSALVALGHEVDVYTRRDDPDLPERITMRPGLNVVHVDAGPPTSLPKDDLLPYMAEFGQALARRWLDEGAPDIVHAHFWMSGLAAEEATRVVPVPRVQTFHALGIVKRRHQGDVDTSPAQRIDVEAHLARECDLVVATCEDEKAELIAMGTPAERIHVVPCGVDLATFRLDVTAEASTRPRIVTVTRLVERKGVDTVIRALESLPEVEYVVAGGPDARCLDDDPEVQRLRGIARECGVADRVEFRGRLSRDAVAGLIASADVVACTPWYEPFGIVPLEAMACGRPVVASAVGGLLDTIEHGVTGFHVPARHPGATAMAIERILTDEDLAGSLSAAGRERAERRYGWTEVARATLEAYDSVLARARAHDGAGHDAGGATRWMGDHFTHLAAGHAWAAEQGPAIDRWGAYLAAHLGDGHRVLAAGNGGSAAEAQHFTAEIVGRFIDDRRPFSALCLSSETSSLTAIGNDYGPDDVFARQVEAHGRAGDVLVLLSTSGRSSNILAAARRARDLGIRVLALTGPAPNPLAELADEAWSVPAPTTCAIQEIHLLLLHGLCASVEARVVAARQPLGATSDTERAADLAADTVRRADTAGGNGNPAPASLEDYLPWSLLPPVPVAPAPSLAAAENPTLGPPPVPAPLGARKSHVLAGAGQRIGGGR